MVSPSVGLSLAVVVPDVSPVDLQVAVVRAKDADSGAGGTISFSIVSVVFVQDNGNSQTYENLFKVVTTAEQDTYVGSIQVASNLDRSLKGRYKVTVEAKDGEAPVHTTQTVLDIFTVDNSYLVRLQFVTPVEEVQSNLDTIKLALTVVTKAQVYVASIQSLDDASTSRASRPQAKAVMEVYFVYSNGTALEVNQLSVLLQSNPDVLAQLVNLG
ncbi:PREDICTED: cadherin-related family member 2-like, partial [Tinamus guttatus]|uniref:cadherin-related family member 2-like n=1 Tax=Tinamus guttatus TaxID=94827 RepID=UPI00052E76F7